MITVGLLSPPVLAGDPKALFNSEAHRFSTEITPLVNGSFHRADAQRAVTQARHEATPRHLVVHRQTAAADLQDVVFNGIVVKPGASLPPSLREITIIGDRTQGVTVLGGR
jgi:hypothetical protein